jgi:periplasmic divalent cation tolerance protein
MQDIPYQVVIMTASNREEAERIAEALVADGLAACVNIIDGIASVYRWKGETFRDAEVLMLAKTHRDRFKDVERRVSELHSYDVPEIIALDLSAASDGYRGFLEDVLGK